MFLGSVFVDVNVRFGCEPFAFNMDDSPCVLCLKYIVRPLKSSQVPLAAGKMLYQIV